MTTGQQVLWGAALIPFIPNRVGMQTFRPCEAVHPGFGVQCRREHGHLHHHSHKDGSSHLSLDWPLEDGE